MPQVEPQFEPMSEPSFASGESSHPAAHPAPRLLVIDDDLVQRMIICRIGAQVGYVATGAATVGEALRCLGDGGQDCVVFHLSLAEHHGIEALKALAGALAGTPVVVINGSGETVPAPAVRVGRMLGLDVRGPIPKPLSLAALRQALVQAIPTLPVAEPHNAATDADPARTAEGGSAPQGDVQILFQPRIDLMTGAPVGCEVLVGSASAADHPAGVHPAGPLLRRALAACAGLVRRHSGFRVAVPAPAAWLDDSSLAGEIEAALAAAGVPAATLVLEIPTGVAMREPERVGAILAGLRRLGVRTALTDFGCGPLSLGALARLPLDEVKLASSLFATPAGSAPQEAVIWRVAEAAILLARHFRIMLVADGVDDALTQQRLVDAGCALVQGRMFAQPLDASALAAWVEAQHARCRAGGDDGPSASALAAADRPRLRRTGVAGPG